MTYIKRFKTFKAAFRAAQRERRLGCLWLVDPLKPKVFQVFDNKRKTLEIHWGEVK
jgi:hypothetical protein